MSIQSTADRVAPSAATRYPKTYAKVLKALEDREARGTQALLDYAEAKGANMDEVRALLSDLGATMPPVPRHSDPVVADLVDFAARHGYTGARA